MSVMIPAAGPHSRACRAPGLVILLVLAVLLPTGCGVPEDGTTRTVHSADVPHQLLDQDDNAAPSKTPTGPMVAVPQIYLVDQDRQLVPQDQPLEASGLEPLLGDLLAALSAAPTERQRARGLSSALEAETGLRLLQVTDATARIEVGESASSADRLPLAIAQIVLTATSVQGVDSVLLFQDGEAVEAPLPGGELTSRPLNPDDYTALLTSPTPRSPKAAPTGNPSTEQADRAATLLGINAC